MVCRSISESCPLRMGKPLCTFLLYLKPTSWHSLACRMNIFWHFVAECAALSAHNWNHFQCSLEVLQHIRFLEFQTSMRYDVMILVTSSQLCRKVPGKQGHYDSNCARQTQGMWLQVKPTQTWAACLAPCNRGDIDLLPSCVQRTYAWRCCDMVNYSTDASCS